MDKRSLVGRRSECSGSCLTIGNKAELLLAALHRMWPGWAAAKPALQLQSHTANVMKAAATQTRLCSLPNPSSSFATMSYDRVIVKYFFYVPWGDPVIYIEILLTSQCRAYFYISFNTDQEEDHLKLASSLHG